MEKNTFMREGSLYLEHIFNFAEGLADKKTSLEDIIAKAGGANKIAFISVDIVKGFCSQGAMASDRMKVIAAQAAKTLMKAGKLGVEKFIFTCDQHEKDSIEFLTWPPHCIKGTAESELEDDLLELPIKDQFKIVPKSSISSFVDTELIDLLEEKPEVNSIIVMGGVTDLCLYHLVAGLRFYASARHKNWRVIVPADCVATFDCDYATSQKIGLEPHYGDLFQSIFLEQIKNIGAEVMGGLL